jgi:predicted regulator of Ras-like GTPase activity (Roadblock/LC7/MglB family)
MRQHAESGWLLGFFKGFFGRRGHEQPAASPPANSAVSANADSAGASLPDSLPAPDTAPVAPAPTPVSENADTLSIPLLTVLRRLPDELRHKVSRPPARSVEISIPLRTVLPQLAKGSVRIPFRELRELSPPGTFHRFPGEDQAMVELPLQELLPRLRKDLFGRRAVQRRVELPEDIAPIFGPKGELRLPSEGEAASPQPLQSLGQPAADPGVPAHDWSGRPASASANPPAPPPTIAAAPPVQTWTAPPAAAEPLPVRPPVESTSPRPAAPAPTSAVAPAAYLKVPLQAVSAKWPRPVQDQLAALAAPDAVLAIPLEEVEQGLKRGRVQASWAQIRAWLQPEISPAVSGPAIEGLLELPLPVLAPLFLAHARPATASKRVVVPEDIPSVFETGGGRSAGAMATPVRLEATAAPGPVAPSGAPPLAYAHAQNGQPSRPAVASAAPAESAADELKELLARRKHTPAELVREASRLPGIAGSLVVLPEGLSVAGQLPDGLDSEILSAFVPQMFARTAQYLKQFQFADPHQITLVVNRRPLAIYKTPKVYFAVLGRDGEPLPEAQLNVIAAHLEN